MPSSAITISKVTKYYTFGSQRVAMRRGEQLYYLHGDHLGSTSLTTDQNGNKVSEGRYLPYGEDRWAVTSPTDFGFTGQRKDGFGLYDYNARFYSPYLNRFVSPDPIIPDPKNPQSLNRYSYVVNNPVRFTDSTGHCFVVCIAAAVLTVQIIGVGIAVGAKYTGALDPAAESIANGIREGGRATADAVQDAIIEGSTETYPLGSPSDPYSSSRPTLGGEFTGPLHLPGGSTADLPSLDTGLDFPAPSIELPNLLTAKSSSTYVLVDPITGEVKYVGRTSNLARREKQHARSVDKGGLEFVPDRTDLTYEQTRGREQLLFDEHGGFDKLLNKIRPIRENNPRIDEYLKAGKNLQ